jgi:hypothetical protein
MNGKDLLFVLTHLFRKKGKTISIDDAVAYLSFRCRYGTPSNVRRMLTVALQNKMISRDEDEITAEFLFDKQVLNPNLTQALNEKVIVESDIDELI